MPGAAGAEEGTARQAREATASGPGPEAAGSPWLSIAAPCFNEAEGIEAVVAEWHGILDACPQRTEIVLCNDGSTDGTREVLESLAAANPRLRVVHFDTNGGYGRALSAAIDATRGRYVATIDSDGQFDVADAVTLAQRLEHEGLAAITGYRRKKQDSVFRVLADRGLNLIVRSMFGVALRDTNCALKVAQGDVLRGLRIEARGYPTPTEICVRLAALGHALGEAPVAHRERAAGASKLHPFRTAWSMWRFLLYLRRRLKLHSDRIIVEP